MSEKRRHKTLSLNDKCSILLRLDKGETSTKLALEFNVGKSTISNLKKNRSKILSYALSSEEGTSNKQTMRKSDYPLLDAAVYEWLLQARSLNTPITGLILREKAKFFQTIIYPNLTDFRASQGWLDKFKKRHGIRYLSTTEESICSAAVEPFKKKFAEMIDTINLVPEQIYNAECSGLFCRPFPEKLLVNKNETQSPDRKLTNERITVMPCANATGNHKLRMLIIGKPEEPSDFKNCNLPVLYKSQTKASMNLTVFKEWFHDEFVPSVRNHLKSKNLEQKAVLFLDNCPGHPDEPELVSDNGKIVVMFIPPNCAPLLMGQNIIKKIKLYYRKTLLTHVVAQKGDVSALANLNFKDVLLFLAAAWEEVQSKTIRNKWTSLLGEGNILEESTSDSDDTSQQVISSLIKNINSDATVSEPDVMEWIEGSEENEFVFKTDDEIVQRVMELSNNEECESQVEETMTVKHEDAVFHFNHCIKWAADNSMPWQQILLLQHMREEAMSKFLQYSKQKIN